MRLAILSLVALAFLATDLTAEAQGVRWATSFDEALKEAQEREVLILCVLNMEGEASNDLMIRLLSTSKSFAKVSRQLVCVYGNRDQHVETKKKVDGKVMDVCPRLGTARCSAHKEIEQTLVRRYGSVMMGDDGNVRTPCQWLVDGTGKVVEVIAGGDRNTGFTEVPEGEFVSRLSAAARKYGPGLSSDEYHELMRLLKEANELKEKGDYSGAASLYQKALKVTRKKVSAVKKAEAALAEINGIAQKGLDKAKALTKEGKYGEALALLRDISAKFKGSSAEKKARKQLKTMKKNPKIAKLMRESEAEQAADVLFAKGQTAEKAKNWKAALKAYKGCVKRYPETKAGKASQKRHDELMSDPEIGPKIREAAAAKDCKGWINLAKNFISNNMPDRARIQLRKVIDNYPGTTYAKQAQAMLDRLK